MSWHLLYSTPRYTEAAIIQGKLEENHIPVQVLNKQDTMYNIALGEYELYVPTHLQDMARSLLNEALPN
jgi:hypothetical protein